MILFSNREILEHQGQEIGMTNGISMQATFSGHRSSLAKCACFFIKITDWMVKSNGVKHLPSGLLECPNQNCGVKLGQFSQAGLRCNCG